MVCSLNINEQKAKVNISEILELFFKLLLNSFDQNFENKLQ